MNAKQSYVPPHLRKSIEQKPKALDGTSRTQFPTLQTTSTVQTTKQWDTSFKQKIDALIELEKLTDEERRARERAKHAMEGWEVLSLTLTKERLEEINQARLRADRLYNAYQMTVDAGTQDLEPLE